MLKKLSAWLRRLSTGWAALSALLIFLLFTALVLPRQSSQAELASNAAGSPDTSFFYSVDNLYRMAEAYGELGRDAYIRARFTFDLIWPLVYAAFLSIEISWLFGRAFSPESRLQLLNLLPIFAAIFDYLENIATSLVMLSFPQRLPMVAFLASLFTLAKWTLIAAGFVLLFVGIGVVIWRSRKANP